MNRRRAQPLFNDILQAVVSMVNAGLLSEAEKMQLFEFLVATRCAPTQDSHS